MENECLFWFTTMGWYLGAPTEAYTNHWASWSCLSSLPAVHPSTLLEMIGYNWVYTQEGGCLAWGRVERQDRIRFPKLAIICSDLWWPSFDLWLVFWGFAAVPSFLLISLFCPSKEERAHLCPLEMKGEAMAPDTSNLVNQNWFFCLFSYPKSISHKCKPFKFHRNNCVCDSLTKGGSVLR